VSSDGAERIPRDEGRHEEKNDQFIAKKTKNVEKARNSEELQTRLTKYTLRR
jgi:hypothetical protein